MKGPLLGEGLCSLGTRRQENARSNSCATTACQVLSAGGAAVPAEPEQARPFMYELFGIPLPR